MLFESIFFANLLMPTILTMFCLEKEKIQNISREASFFWENELFIRTGRSVRYRVAVLISQNRQQRALHSVEITLANFTKKMWKQHISQVCKS